MKETLKLNNTVWLVPLEPFPGRYTEQWYRNIPTVFEEFGFACSVIDGITLTNTIDVGSFLPMNSTVHYKSTQMQNIAGLFQTNIIKDGDSFFIYDLEFWGIEAIRLMAQMNKINVKIFAFLHAASYTNEDAFAIAAPYQKYTEVGWIAMCDKVFVGSEYHKQAIIERRLKLYADPAELQKLSNKIIVTGNPVFGNEYPTFQNVVKKNQLIISNRFDWEKRPNVSLDFVVILKEKHPDWNFVLTTGNPTLKSNKKWLIDYARTLEKLDILHIAENCTKDEYHRHLAESKVMLTNSIEENFGYCIIEACIYNTSPLAPWKLSHPELLNGNHFLLYEDEDEIIEKVEVLMKTPIKTDVYVKKYLKSMYNIMNEIRGEKYPPQTSVASTYSPAPIMLLNQGY